VLGTPSNEDQRFITNESALRYIRGLPKRSKQPWNGLFPNTSTQGLDLLERMLAFNPNKRICVADCISHPYFE
jgi:mitogen-activated protein kinase 1/3